MNSKIWKVVAVDESKSGLSEYYVRAPDRKSARKALLRAGVRGGMPEIYRGQEIDLEEEDQVLRWDYEARAFLKVEQAPD